MFSKFVIHSTGGVGGATVRETESKERSNSTNRWLASPPKDQTRRSSCSRTARPNYFQWWTLGSTVVPGKSPTAVPVPQDITQLDYQTKKETINMHE